MDLTKWIQDARAAGQSDDQIRTSLRESGWGDQDINTALSGASPAAASKTATKRGPLIALIVIVVVLGAGVAAYFLWFQGDEDVMDDDVIESTNEQAEEEVNTNAVTADGTDSENTNDASATITNEDIAASVGEEETLEFGEPSEAESDGDVVSREGWGTFTNQDYQFSFEHPVDYYLLELGEDSGIEPSEPIYGAEATLYSSSTCFPDSFEIGALPADCVMLNVSLDTQENYTPMNFESSGDYIRELLDEKTGALSGYAAEIRSGTETTEEAPVNYVQVLNTTDSIESPQGEGDIVFEVYVLYGEDAASDAEDLFQGVVDSFKISIE